MTNINLDALRAKYFGEEPTQKIKQTITSDNYFIENNRNGYATSEKFVNDLMQCSDDRVYKKGLEGFFEATSAGNYFHLSNRMEDQNGINFYWISYYKGRIRKNLKVPEFDGLLRLLETSRGSEINLTLEELINKAIENIKK